MTLVDATAVAKGYRDRVNEDHKTRIREYRVLVAYMSKLSLLGKPNQDSFETIYSVEGDKVKEPFQLPEEELKRELLKIFK